MTTYLTHPSAESVRLVADRLGPLAARVVFVGGAVVPLLATDPAAPAFRPTDDVDFVSEIATPVAYGRFEEALRQAGFRHDTSPGAPLSRWRVGPVVVDAMPQDPRVLGFGNPWYPAAIETSRRWAEPDPGGRYAPGAQASILSSR